MSDLDNGVLGKPKDGTVGPRRSKSLNFFDAIAKGENPNGQTSVAPAGNACDGTASEWKGSRWGMDKRAGERWGKDPVRRKEGYDPWSY